MHMYVEQPRQAASPGARSRALRAAAGAPRQAAAPAQRGRAGGGGVWPRFPRRCRGGRAGGRALLRCSLNPVAGWWRGACRARGGLSPSLGEELGVSSAAMFLWAAAAAAWGL